MAEAPGRARSSFPCCVTLQVAVPLWTSICPAHCGDYLWLGPYANSFSGPSLQEPGLFEPDVVMAQLRYSGVLETVRIRKEGFPVRLPFQVFIDRYVSQGGS